ncbi:MAG: GNAT family N-acetyltransferase [Lachnospiraceae bacterium]|nr:GNAT family N-acetyltransferase [Lachnospiraceae bacterium]
MNIVRRALCKDIPVIMDLLLQVDMVHHTGRPDLFKGPATKYTEKQLEDIIVCDDTPVFVCVDENDVPMGHAFCMFKQFPDDNVLTDIKTLYIDDICVDEKHRGKHVGTALYDHVVSYARQNGFYNITLNVWSLNPGALAFYESMGLKPQKIGMELVL